MYQKSLSIKYLFIIIFISALRLISANDLPVKNTDKQDERTQIDINQTWSARIAQSFLLKHPGGVTNDEYVNINSWDYEQGIMLEAMRQMWEHSFDIQYFDFIRKNIDCFVCKDGSIRTYQYDEFNLDNINTGRALLFLYEKTREERYKIAADTLRKQLKYQPRTKEGGFWHKKIYPYQMWLDGLYMAEPFYAQYSIMFEEEDNFNDIFLQFDAVYKHTLDKKTGLLYHGWDENKKAKWSDKVTGLSPCFWSRSIGWYLMAIVDVLDFVKRTDIRRRNLIIMLKNVSEALLKYRDDKTGLWYQVTDKMNREGNYLEASCATMFTYVFAKGTNRGYLDKKFLKIAEDTFYSIVETYCVVDEKGFINLYNTCKGAGLGGNPYRDGTFDYYISEPTRTNDFKGYGPLLFSAIELEKANSLNK